VKPQVTRAVSQRREGQPDVGRISVDCVAGLGWAGGRWRRSEQEGISKISSHSTHSMRGN
jgi:hypothetical protein